MIASSHPKTRRNVLRLGLASAILPLAGNLFPEAARAEPLPSVAVWRDRNCGCCGGWVQHMRQAGFAMTVRATDNMAAVKAARGVPEDMQSCHTAVVDGYVIEGHVPASDIIRFIGERPSATGLALPGMPASAPGMDQPGEPYAVMMFGSSFGSRVYAKH